MSNIQVGLYVTQFMDFITKGSITEGTTPTGSTLTVPPLKIPYILTE